MKQSAKARPTFFPAISLGLLATAMLLPFNGGRAQVDMPHSTAGSVVLSNGRPLNYTVDMGRIPIRDGASNEIRAYMFYVAYRVPAKQPRPLTFLWNGGPGTPSAILHLQSVGPRRITSGGAIESFAGTALASSDLVFVDAPGTGFSRIAEPRFADQFYQTRGDVAAFTDFVRAWRLLHKAEASPLYLAGESWGGFRAAAVAHALQLRNIDVRGIAIISGRLGLPNSLPDNKLRALYTVQRAVVAQYHGKLSPQLPKDSSALQQRVGEWVRSTYAPALDRVAVLTPAEREKIAGELSSHTGIPQANIDRSTLVITPAQYLRGLLADRGQTLETFDMTKTRESAEPEHPEVVERYLRKDLGYVTDLAYMTWTELAGFAPDGSAIKSPNPLWNYHAGFFQRSMRAEEIDAMNEELIANGEAPRGVDTPEAADAMTLNPAMRMFIADGRYDSMSSCASKQEIVDRQTPALQQRIFVRCYDAGHMVYSEPSTRRQFSDDFQAFVTGRPLP